MALNTAVMAEKKTTHEQTDIIEAAPSFKAEVRLKDKDTLL